MTDAGLAARLEGLLFFPVTPFDAAGALNLDAYRAHLRAGLDAGPGAVFAACGTGEFHALTPDEYQRCVATAVEVAAGAVPVIAGVGYGTAVAADFARRAEAAGADGLLVLPPYLVKAGQRGLLRHYTALADATGLQLIVYQRDNAILTPETVARLAGDPRIIGLKDGVGDLDLLQRVISAVRTAHPDRPEFRYFNGLPTAELTGPAYRGLGVTLYSSAVFCFVPEIALAFHAALGRDDHATVRRLLDGFYRPLVELRDRGSGYAVSLVKAGVRLRGLDVGEVRAPLAEPEPAHVAELAALIDTGLKLIDPEVTP
ncbi:5-dehydro-4-deoxyglucarate dehydratase [Streptomyces millisiae]|uniref:Probable 5-dehydro-4-deoxyglucarate dehydratase n=1 Tax=Streptomyces millisiae TaxID=3075542 RepID=A0ABU2LNN3_9ACTN|nr:5-dehydro-4-deoxyglucarate dehydratase [Streptomyces sp. DSM 44918]MDT0319178.1 5-dehydro-4-deoxyglucarate dehydratase [Streptomyces sp. DSM 44918]